MLNKEDLSRANFSCNEFFYSKIAINNNIENYPSKEDEQSILANLMFIADVMQEIRDLLGHPIAINSGYRCLALNRLLKSSDSSQHLQGLACDFVAPSFGSPERIMKFLDGRGFVVDQCLCEGYWLHLSKLSDIGKNRKMYGYYLYDTDHTKRVFQPLSNQDYHLE